MISFWTGLIGYIQYLVSISTNSSSKVLYPKVYSKVYIIMYKYYLQNSNFFFKSLALLENRNWSFLNIPEGGNKPMKAIPSSSLATVAVQIH